MEKILQIVFWCKMFSLLDGFPSSNEGLVAELVWLKMNFRTTWGLFSFKRMSFIIINVSAKFQRAMDIIFHGLIGQRIVVNLDDVIIFSKKWSDHICHLKQIIEWCQKYANSLNPKMSVFGVFGGVLLQHIIGKSGIKIDLERVKVITQILFLVNKKLMQCFLGKIIFLRKFISIYA